MGDYKPDSIKDLTFNSSLKESYLANVDDVLHLDGTLAEGNGPDVTYRWHYYLSTAFSNLPIVEAGKTAKLDLPINMPTGKYYLILEATNTKTGVKGYKKITLNVKRLTSEGWLLLTWKNNQTNMSIVSSENEIFKDFLKTNAQYPMSSKPEKLYCLNDWDPLNQTIAIKSIEPNLYFLDHNTFEVSSEGAETFKIPINLGFAHFDSEIYYNEFYIWDSNGLVYQAPRSGGVNLPNGFDQPLQGNYKASNFLIPLTSTFPIISVFFDVNGKRFLYQPYGVNQVLPFQTKPASAPFDMSNFQDKIKFAGLGASDVSYVVAENAAGEHKLYTLLLEDALNVYPAKSVESLNIPNNAKPTFYALSGKLPLLYFIANNSLYLYKMGEKKISQLYTFPANENVSALKMLSGSPWFTSTHNPAVETRLGIATNNAQGGIFYTFDLSATGALKSGKYTSRVDGFAPIVDIAYKMQK